MAVSVRSAFAWIRRVAGWCFAVEERLADVVLIGGGALVLLCAALASGLAGFLSLSRLQQHTLWGLFLASSFIWLLLLAIFWQRGWLKLFGPLLYYDLVRIARRSRYVLTRFLYAILLGLVLCWLYLVLRMQIRAVNTRDMASFAESFFYTFIFVQFSVIAFLTPAYTAGAIAEEKERRTLEFVLATDLRNREIVLSKLMSRLCNLSLLVLTGLPILSLLQFLGGVDPNLVLASFVATLLTMLSLACLSIVNSVLARRARDAIALTYLAAAGYLALSGASWYLLDPSWGLSEWLGEDGPIALADVVHTFSAGNPIALLVLLLNDLDKGKYIADVLPGLLFQYAIFQLLFASACAGWSILRLRAIALRQAQGDAPAKKHRRRFLLRPRIGDFPMLWKETFAERGLRMHILMRVFLALLVFASLIPAFVTFGQHLGAFSSSRPGAMASSAALASDINMWVRFVGTTVACLMLLGVAARAAGSVSGERDRQTLDGLLTSPLEVRAILGAKWLGNVLSMRWGWAWLGVIYAIGALTGGLDFAALSLLLVAWFVYAGVVSAIGMRYSITCPTTLSATVWTLFATGAAAVGHWLIWLCVAPLLFLGGSDPRFLRWIISFQLGITPPIAMGAAFSFTKDEVTRGLGRGREMDEALGFAILGLLFWGVIAAMIYASGYRHFAQRTGRLGFVPLRRPASLQEPAHASAVNEGEISGGSGAGPLEPDQSRGSSSVTAE